MSLCKKQAVPPETTYGGPEEAEEAMLKLTGKGTAHTCDGITRRDFLEAGSLSAIGLSLADMTKLQAAGALKQTQLKSRIKR